MGAQANFRSTPGSGRSGVGTEATTRRKFLNPPLRGSGDPTSPDPSKKLALRPRGVIMTGGCNAGDDVERGTAQGARKLGAPHSSPLIAALADAKDALEFALPKLHIEDRMNLAVALCRLTHVLRGGAL